MDGVNITYTENEIIGMEPEEKLNTMVKLTLSTNEQVKKMNSLLVGTNGNMKDSVCGKIDNLTTRLNVLYGIVMGAGTVILVIIGIIKFLIREA